mgnify:CR=1 FL=1
MRRFFYWRWYLLLKWWWRQVLDLILLIFFFNHVPSIAPLSRVFAWWFGDWDLCPELLPADLGTGYLLHSQCFFSKIQKGMAAQSVSLSLGTKVLASISRAMWGQSKYIVLQLAFLNKTAYAVLFRNAKKRLFLSGISPCGIWIATGCGYWFCRGAWNLSERWLECSRWQSCVGFLDWRHHNVQKYLHTQ